MRKYLVILTFALLILGIDLSAQSFSAAVDRNPMSLGDQFQVTFTLSGEGHSFRPPSFENFNFLGGPAQSQSYRSDSRGNMERTIAFTYYLQAAKEGTFTIESATIISGGKTIKSNPIKIVVKKGAVNSQDNSEKSESERAREIIEPNMFIKLNGSKSSVYLGEPLIVTYQLYKHPQLTLVDLDLPKIPAMSGFWSQDLDDIKSIKWTTEVVNGVRFETAVLKRSVIIPQQSGKIKIDPMEMKSVVRLRVQKQRNRQRSMFDDFFNDPYKDFNYSFKSNSLSVNVLPLPSNPPDDFTGGVGKIEMEAWLDRSDAKTNEPVTLKVKLSGSGNLKLIETKELNLPADFEAFEPKIADNMTLTASGFKGNKTFEYIMIPRHAGKYELEPVSISYYDLDSKQFKTLTSDKFTINVEKGDGVPSAGSISGVSKEEIKYLGKDIRFIKESIGSLDKKGSSFFSSIGFYILGILPAILYFLFFILRKKRKELIENKALLKNKKAKKVAIKRLSLAEKYLKLSESDKFYEEMTKAIWGYLSDKLSIPLSELNKDKISNILTKLKIENEMILNLIDLIDSCEFARYAPSESNSDMQSNYEQAANIITILEGRLK